MIISKEKFDYPFEIMKDRKEVINKEISKNGNLSINSYNLLLKQIGVDIYDSINNLKEWNRFTIKGSLYVGELTFYSGGGFSKIKPFDYDLKLGKELDLSEAMQKMKVEER